MKLKLPGAQHTIGACQAPDADAVFALEKDLQVAPLLRVPLTPNRGVCWFSQIVVLDFGKTQAAHDPDAHDSQIPGAWIS